MDSATIIKTLKELKEQTATMPPLLSELLVRAYDRDPFCLLIGCILSLRTRDTTTYPICKKLFAMARTPQAISRLSTTTLESIIRPIGFYRTKAKTIQNIAHNIATTHGGIVPTHSEALAQLPGVGPKTVAFMECYAYQKAALCVDTHVHRLANAFGWIRTRTPHETEIQLKKLIPEEWWSEVNRILVTWGQQVCTPYPQSKQKKMAHQRLCPCIRTTHALSHP